MRRDIRNRPSTISTAVVLMCIVQGVGLARTIIETPYIFSLALNNFNAFIRLVITGLFWLCIYMIWRGKNWARIIYLICFIVLVLMFVFVWLPVYSLSLSGIIFIGSVGMNLVAVILLFQKNSSDWFRQMKGSRYTHQKHPPEDYSSETAPPYHKHEGGARSKRQAEWAKASREGEEEARRRAEEMRVQRMAEEEREKRHAEEERTRRKVAEEARQRTEEQRARRRIEEERARRRTEEELAREEIKKSFDIFELPYSASFDDVKKKYRILLRLFHPDKHSSDNILRDYAEEKTKEINNAFNILKLRHFKV